MPKPSKEYLEALEDSKKIHHGKLFTGLFLRSHAPFIKEIVAHLGCKTALDYGCGKGRQYQWVMPKHGTTLEQYWGINVEKYDPAWPPFAREPSGNFDLVICTHTLSTIPVVDLEWVIDRLYAMSNKAIYISERIGGEGKKIGPSELRPIDWSPKQWMEILWRPKDIEVTLATRVIDKKGGKITSHYRLSTGAWSKVTWPPNIKFMDHTWA